MMTQLKINFLLQNFSILNRMGSTDIIIPMEKSLLRKHALLRKAVLETLFYNYGDSLGQQDLQGCLYTGQKMKFSIKDFFSKFGQIPSFVRIWSHLLKKSLMTNFIFCAGLPVIALMNMTNDQSVSCNNRLLKSRNHLK